MTNILCFLLCSIHITRTATTLSKVLLIIHFRSTDEKVVYPINVCRNAARTASITDNVLVSDIQLMPSENLAQKFWDMMNAFKYADCPNKVFVIPIFEVESTEEIPRTKHQLVQLVKEKKAVYFHKMICSHCQRFPGIEGWLETDPGDIIKVRTKLESRKVSLNKNFPNLYETYMLQIYRNVMCK